MRGHGLAVGVTVLLAVTRLDAQAFNPPTVQHATRGTHLGLYGFGVLAGGDVAAQSQLVLGVTLDAGTLLVSELLVRPSLELGFANGVDTYVGSLEVLYRFAPDGAGLLPYAGGGPGLYGHAHCQADARCPAVWLNAVVGVEVRFRSTFSWIVQYHGLDLLQHSRLELGLTTRRGN
jgi:hypothetical protein